MLLLYHLLRIFALCGIALKEIAGISSSTLAKLGKVEYVSMESIHRICAALKCDISEVISVSNEK